MDEELAEWEALHLAVQQRAHALIRRMPFPVKDAGLRSAWLALHGPARDCVITYLNIGSLQRGDFGLVSDIGQFVAALCRYESAIEQLESLLQPHHQKGS